MEARRRGKLLILYTNVCINEDVHLFNLFKHMQFELISSNVGYFTVTCARLYIVFACAVNVLTLSVGYKI